MEGGRDGGREEWREGGRERERERERAAKYMYTDPLFFFVRLTISKLKELHLAVSSNSTLIKFNMTLSHIICKRIQQSPC